MLYPEMKDAAAALPLYLSHFYVYNYPPLCEFSSLERLLINQRPTSFMASSIVVSTSTFSAPHFLNTKRSSKAQGRQ